MNYSYSKAGVNVDKVKGIQKGIAGLLNSTLTPDVLLGAGHYAGLLKFGGKTLALHTDGVGSKVLIAQQLGKYDTVGIDAIAMNVNDLICLGARPVAAVDYLAVEKTNGHMIYEIMKGVSAGAMESKCAVVGGETAVVPDLIRGIAGRGFDLSVTCIGEIEGGVITGKDMQAGDVIIGLESSGIHSNGYTLARKVLLKSTEKGHAAHGAAVKGVNSQSNSGNGYASSDLKPVPKGKSPLRDILEEMLVPTKIYSNAVMDVLRNSNVHGLAHITGGAFSKLQRIGAYAKKGFLLSNMPGPKPIFQKIQNMGKIPDKEMYRTFNMGIGFCIVCPKSEADGIVSICSRHNIGSQLVGHISDKRGVFLRKGGNMINLS
ncbi:MAG: phosphoribosylformylglycinamidine cyclo-ligase [Candidatus Micrarchaeota archaeon]